MRMPPKPCQRSTARKSTIHRWLVIKADEVENLSSTFTSANGNAKSRTFPLRNMDMTAYRRFCFWVLSRSCSSASQNARITLGSSELPLLRLPLADFTDAIVASLMAFIGEIKTILSTTRLKRDDSRIGNRVMAVSLLPGPS